jgi:GGDEF domain-containing protein
MTSFSALGALVQLPGVDGPFGPWLYAGGLLLGAGLLWARQRRPATAWGAPPNADMAVPSYRGSLPRLSQELARMRSYERSLAVLVVDIDRRVAKPDGTSGKRNGRELAMAFWHMGAILRDLLRNSDIVTSDPADDRFVILLPEANRAQAELAANRLRTPLAAATQLHVRMGVAEFPGDGLIIEELVKSAGAESAGQGARQKGTIARLDS